MDFEPWRHAEGDWEPPSNKEWTGTLITIRLAYATMFRSKAQLIDMVVKEEEAAMDMAEAVFNVADFCKGLSALMDAAETRLSWLHARRPQAASSDHPSAAACASRSGSPPDRGTPAGALRREGGFRAALLVPTIRSPNAVTASLRLHTSHRPDYGNRSCRTCCRSIRCSTSERGLPHLLLP